MISSRHCGRASVVWADRADTSRLAAHHQDQVRLQLHQNYCNVLPTEDYDPTYASIEEYQPSFLHTNASWVSHTSSGIDDDYTNHLRTSSYAMLRPGPVHQERFTASRAGSRAGLRTGSSASVFQSLPYVAGSQVTSPGEEVRELEEYARQYEVTGRGQRAARTTPASGRDSVMTITSSVLSGQSDSSGDTLRPTVSVSSSHSELTNSESREETGSQVYTRMRPIFQHGYNDGRRKSDYYSWRSGERGEEEVGRSLYPACSVSDRINQMERLGRENSNHKEKDEADFSLSKSVPNLLSEEELAEGGQEVCAAETSYTYLDPEKKLKVTDNTLKLIQKQAVLDYYTRQKKSSTDLTKLTKRAESSLRSEEGEDVEREGSKNSSFESERCFIRSISQGSLSQLSQSYQNSESYNSSSTGPLAKIGSHSPSVFNCFSKYQKSSEIPNQDVSQRCDSVNNDSFLNPETGHGWKKRLEAPAEINDHHNVPRSLSPDLPPPPPLQDCEVLQNDSPLPPPPSRMEDEADKRSEVSTTNGKSRRSPATLAARGAPGWERFLGVTTSSVTFTSDEARKFRRTKDRARARGVEAGPKSLPFVLGKESLKPLQPAKSSPSLTEKAGGQGAASQPGDWWKTSMDSLRLTGGTGECRGGLVRAGEGQVEKESVGNRAGVSHSHSSSDSGLSSLSGRTSCMSPLSVVSNTSSASSGSSRASLRSASIVSTCTIPLDEDDEREPPVVVRRNMTQQGKTSQEDLVTRAASELFSLVPAPPSIAWLFGSEAHHNRIMAQYLRGVFTWDLDQLQESLLRSEFSPAPPAPPPTELESANQDEQGQQLVRAKKCELEGLIRKRISSLKMEEATFRDKENKNLEVGKLLLMRLSTEARQNEVDKYKLHVEEVDKITSLLLSLSSRLARSEISLINLKKNFSEDGEENLKNKREKLLEQLEEAKSLKASIDKRGSVVTSLLVQYLTEAELEQYKTFMRTKMLLVTQSKLVAERQQQSQQQLEGLTLHRFVL